MKEKMKDMFFEMAAPILLAYIVPTALIMFLFKCVLMLSLIPSGSMEGTIMPGDVVISTRLDLSEETIHRYDILVFNRVEDPDTLYIKRVIGLPGETVVIKEGMVYVDGVELDNSFVNGIQNQKGSGTYVVPEGCYFFMGDNRNNSNDSRYWDEKYVPIENISAKAKFILLPFTRVASVEYE